MGDGPVARNRSQEAPPQFAAQLKHPWFEVNPVGNVDDTKIDVVGKLVESVQADMHAYGEENVSGIKTMNTTQRSETKQGASTRESALHRQGPSTPTKIF